MLGDAVQNLVARGFVHPCYIDRARVGQLSQWEVHQIRYTEFEVSVILLQHLCFYLQWTFTFCLA
jgi:hypothetical protein